MAKFLLLVLAMVLCQACGDGDNEAEQHGVGASCAEDADCTEEGQRCLTQFKGGYCGISACTSDAQCLVGSRCVTHDDGTNYCFLVCETKEQCNRLRPLESEANCSSSLNFIEGQKDKACVPPSGGG